MQDWRQVRSTEQLDEFLIDLSQEDPNDVLKVTKEMKEYMRTIENMEYQKRHQMNLDFDKPVARKRTRKPNRR